MNSKDAKLPEWHNILRKLAKRIDCFPSEKRQEILFELLIRASDLIGKSNDENPFAV